MNRSIVLLLVVQLVLIAAQAIGDGGGGGGGGGDIADVGLLAVVYAMALVILWLLDTHPLALVLMAFIVITDRQVSAATVQGRDILAQIDQVLQDGIPVTAEDKMRARLVKLEEALKKKEAEEQKKDKSRDIRASEKRESDTRNPKRHKRHHDRAEEDDEIL